MAWKLAQQDACVRALLPGPASLQSRQLSEAVIHVVHQVKLRNDDRDLRGLDARLKERNRRLDDVLKEQAAKHPQVAKPQKKAQKKPL